MSEKTVVINNKGFHTLHDSRTGVSLDRGINKRVPRSAWLVARELKFFAKRIERGVIEVLTDIDETTIDRADGNDDTTSAPKKTSTRRTTPKKVVEPGASVGTSVNPNTVEDPNRKW